MNRALKVFLSSKATLQIDIFVRPYVGNGILLIVVHPTCNQLVECLKKLIQIFSWLLSHLHIWMFYRIKCWKVYIIVFKNRAGISPTDWYFMQFIFHNICSFLCSISTKYIIYSSIVYQMLCCCQTDSNYAIS